MFEPLPTQFSFPEAEKRILAFWEQHSIFQKSLDGRRGAPRFVFYEGPPTANGLPHPGHCLTRSIKDLFPRYQTMCGKLVERKAGWDTHGLPVEVEVCKELGIHTKQEIEAYGVEKFVRKCIESVFRYTREWEQMTRRLGFWVNLEEAYVTFHQSYVESVWWSLKTLFDRGLLYQGHKVVWWWAQGGTALSAGEVGEGYRTVRDPSVYVRFPLVAAGFCTGRADVAADPRVGRSQPEIPPGKRVSLLVWTTTPWTLISNHFAAVGPDVDYSLVHDTTRDEYFYIATALVNTTAEKAKHKLDTVATCKGSDLVGLRYVPPFDCYYEREIEVGPDLPQLNVTVAGTSPGDRDWPAPLATAPPPARRMKMKDVTRVLKAGGDAHIGWRVMPANFIDLETGTGIVHIAPAFGEVDFNLLQEERQRFLISDALPLMCAVAPDGTLTAEAGPKYAGRWVKDADKDVLRELRERGVLLHQETIEHEYPFCPRAEDDPLIQYARKSWFVRTSQFKEEFLKNNDKVHWLPEHIQEGRFGDFLRNNVDWALSRERYWGTPLPIWVCEQTGKMEAIGSYAELLAKPGLQGTEVWEQAKKADPSLPDHLKVHKPYIDAVTYASPYVSGYCMRRVPEVIDCWWDAGSMPFAQWGFPHVPESVGTFAERFPADFISEAIDQTRGWFYGLLSISTLLFGDTGALTEAWKAIGDRGVELEAKFGAGKSLEEIAAGIQPERPDRLHANSFLLTLAPFGLETIGRDVEKLRERVQSASMLEAIVSPQQTKGLPPRDGRYPIPYKACIVLGHVMGEDGLKMSKRTKNYKEPSYIFDSYGADAMRWFFFSAQPPWTSVRFQEANIRDAQREFLVRLYNVFSFFNIYSNIDGFAVNAEGRMQNAEEEPATGSSPHSAFRILHSTGRRPVPQRSELDRWIIGELHRAIRDVRAALDRFENFPAAGRIKEFVDALSNWYVRRSRERFWRATERRSDEATNDSTVWSASDQDKWDAYNTLHECLLTLSKLIAPFTPFFAETMYQNLAGTQALRHSGTKAADSEGTPLSPSVPLSLRPLSVHLCDYPQADESLIDESLAQEMDLVRDVVSLGRAARTAAKLKVRQPLALAEIILTRREHAAWLEAHSALIAEELNIKRVELTTEAEHYVTYQVKPDFKAIGPKFGKLAPQVAAGLAKLDAAAARKALTETGRLAVELTDGPVHLTAQEVEVRLEAKPGWSAAQGRCGVVVVKTELTAELREEGLCRELIHQVQALRKAQNLPYSARVTLYAHADEQVLAVLRRFANVVESECLAPTIKSELPPAGAEVWTGKVEGHAATLGIVRT